jgi:DNA mismatch repair protein MutL
MGRIRILDEYTKSKISAGEVVERPASVVKELVENSIDAGSSEILIEIKKAGKNFIRVVDNGQGMDEEDLTLAVSRYATSKIQDFEDIYKITTLGFRGEALPAIASVSYMEIKSKTRKEELGNFIKLEAGTIKKKGKTQMPSGTEVVVKNLFFNTPARRKFLKSDSTEYSHILDILLKFGLAFPEIEFKFLSQDKKILDLRKANFKERIEELFPEVRGNLIKIEADTPIFKVLAFLSHPAINFPRRIRQYTFVNKRPVVSGLLYNILDRAYQGLIEGRAYPAVFLFLDINPQLIDVNVHPAKREIKFRNEHDIYELLLNILRDELKGEGVVKVIAPQGGRDKDTTCDEKRFYSPEISSREIELVAGEIREIQHTLLEEERSDYLVYKNRYIIWLDEEGINIVDQHAGWEKVLYQRIKKHLESAKIETQKLLLPQVINLNPHSAEVLKQNMSLFLKLGFDIKEFGENSFIIHSCPTFIKKEASQVLNQVIAEIVSQDKPEDKDHTIIASLACHSAIKSGDRLSPEEIKELIEEVKNLSPPYCPHGRPALIKIKWQDIEREFGRK